MRYLFLTNTPAHVHLYKHAVTRLRNHGHDVRLLAREYGVTTDLLEGFDIEHTVYGEAGTDQFSLLRNLPGHFAAIAREARAFDPDLAFGMGLYATFAGFVSRTPTVIVVDSEPDGLDHAISRRVVRAMLTPEAFRKDLGDRQYAFSGFKESAYLHPDIYSQGPDVRSELDLDPGERFAILRFNAFGSHHDVGRSGFSPEQRRTLIERLDDHVTVFVSDEGGEMSFDDLPARPFSTRPTRLHDALAAADLLVADTQTTVTEAALLGTPAIRSNSFVGEEDMGNFLELEAQNLVYNLSEFESVLDAATDIVESDAAAERWRERRDEYVADTVNLTDVLVDVATNPASIDEVDALSR